MKQAIIFTDLDGTLLDHKTYSFAKALPALELLRQKNIPLIICSSKTRSEIEYYRKKLSNDHPFISENGGGIFMPKKYFRIQNAEFRIEENDRYHVVRLGASYSAMRKAIEELRAEGFNLKGFGDMTAEEVSDVANMNFDEAIMAKERDFDEPFVFGGSETELQRLFSAITQKGFNYTQGRFYHILGNSDKGRAVSILTGMYKDNFGEIRTVALGDSPNDIPMLEMADYPVAVKKPDGNYDKRINMPNLIKADGIGPEGWNNAVLQLHDLLKDY